MMTRLRVDDRGGGENKTHIDPARHFAARLPDRGLCLGATLMRRRMMVLGGRRREGERREGDSSVRAAKYIASFFLLCAAYQGCEVGFVLGSRNFGSKTQIECEERRRKRATLKMKGSRSNFDGNRDRDVVVVVVDLGGGCKTIHNPRPTKSSPTKDAINYSAPTEKKR